MSAEQPIRVVVIDDSALNRQILTQMLESESGVSVVGRAGDGDEGLKQVFQTHPDVVTLDLEMPKMDGFTFLRILMSRQPTPVVVISSFDGKDNVFKALELGALDFISKPGRPNTTDLRAIADQLLAKIKLVRELRVATLDERARRAGAAGPISPATASAAPPASVSATPRASTLPPVQAAAGEPLRVVAIGASTGGPPALQQLLQALDPGWPIALLITQHMPARFTRAFAERLGRTTPFASAKEAEEGDRLQPGKVLVAPGSGSLLLARQQGGLVVQLEAGSPHDRFVPNIDRMFTSAADAVGSDLLGIVLTGMAGDGARGVRAIKAAGGTVFAEAAETAVIFGMPHEAIATGGVDEVVALPKMAEAIGRFVRRLQNRRNP